MGPNNLDALCKRYGIDNGRREKHGALLDAELLADVFLALIGGRQTAMQLTASSGRRADDSTEPGALPPRPFPLACRLTPEDESAHAELVKSLGSSALWLRRSRAR
jgi:DNA polymerase-3 subunit epsilon